MEIKNKFEIVRALLISSRSLVCVGIHSHLTDEQGIELSQATNNLQVIEYLKTEEPDVIIVDDNSNGNDSLETIQLISQKSIATKVILLIDKNNLEKEQSAVQAGARGILLENAAQSDLVRCIKNVSRGSLWIRREILEKFATSFLLVSEKVGENKNLDKKVPNLTPRETDILILMGRRYKNKQIANELYITTKTVKNYVSRIYNKLGIDNREEVSKFLGLID